jgi:glycosyltransferase involved in cell wall biosynthesis
MAKAAKRPVVLHVMEAFAGGTERHLIDLVRHVSDVDHVLAIPSYHHGKSTADSAARAEAAGGRVERAEMGRSRSPRAHLSALVALRRLIRRVEPDVVHGHSSIGGAMARIATIGTGTPVIYTPNGLSRNRWAIAVERLLRDRADRMIAVSESERRFALQKRLAHEGRIITIRNGIDLRPLAPLRPSLRTRLGLSEDVPLIGCVGRLSRQKAPEVFVAACRRIHQARRDVHFVLVGSGPLQEQVERAIHRAGLSERLHLIPCLPGAAAAMAEFDVYVLPSRFEGGPYTPMEAMRAGTPVVVTHAAGNADLVTHRVNGLLTPPDDPERLASEVLSLLADPDLCRSLVSAGHLRLAEFDVQVQGHTTRRVYEDLLAAGTAAPGPMAPGRPGRPSRRPSPAGRAEVSGQSHAWSA